MRKTFRLAALAAATLFAATLATAQRDLRVLWKLVDDKGKVTYVDKAPGSDFKGKATRIEVDLAANRATLRDANESTPPVLLPLTAPELKRVKADVELARAREDLEAAKKALEGGREPTPAETQWIGRQGGGARPVPTDAYRARIEALEKSVKAAESEVERAQQAARQAAID